MYLCTYIHTHIHIVHIVNGVEMRWADRRYRTIIYIHICTLLKGHRPIKNEADGIVRKEFVI